MTPEGPDKAGRCRLYLILSVDPADAGALLPLIDDLIDAGDVACVECDLAGLSAADRQFVIDRIRPAVQGRQAAFLLVDDAELARDHHCDGVRCSTAAAVAGARRVLGANGVVGAWIGHSRHDGMLAGEAGADFVMIEPDPSLDDDLLAWWSELMALPAVASGVDREDLVVAAVEAGAEFVAVDGLIWSAPDGAVAGLRRVRQAIDRARQSAVR